MSEFIKHFKCLPLTLKPKFNQRLKSDVFFYPTAKVIESEMK